MKACRCEKAPGCPSPVTRTVAFYAHDDTATLAFVEGALPLSLKANSSLPRLWICIRHICLWIVGQRTKSHRMGQRWRPANDSNSLHVQSCLHDAYRNITRIRISACILAEWSSSQQCRPCSLDTLMRTLEFRNEQIHIAGVYNEYPALLRKRCEVRPQLLQNTNTKSQNALPKESFEWTLKTSHLVFWIWIISESLGYV